MSSPPGGAGPHAGVATAPTPLHAYVNALRPRQWIKNALVIAAAGAAGALSHDDVPARLAVAFLAFCLLASGTYAINDVRDAEEDRLHPRKRHRPVAAGQIDPRAATLFGGALMFAGLLLCALLSPQMVLVGFGYLALTLSYTLVWRHIALFDVGAIAGGFVLRAVAGGVAAPVTLSNWFLLVVTFMAVFVAAGKRLSELKRTRAGREQPRAVLERYTAARLRLLIAASAVGALVAYVGWAFQPDNVDAIPWRSLTVVPFAACLLRYGARLRVGDGEAPEDLVLGDRWLLVAGAIWLGAFALSVHAAG